MAQILQLKIRGLYTNPNCLSECPEGSLSIANDVVIDKESVAESRRGQAKYGIQLSTAPDKLFNYKNAIIARYGNKLAYDSDGSGTFVDYTGTYENPDSEFKIRSIEANRNFYFTSSEGIKKLDSLTSTPVQAGAIKALGGTGQTTGSSGFLLAQNQVAYRMLFGHKDLNNNLILGSPSNRVIVANSEATDTRDTSLTFLIPNNITKDWFYQIYRSQQSGGINIEPSDELYLVYEGNPTDAQIAAGKLTITDNTPDDLMGVTLYTSPSQGGVLLANEMPPFAKDLEIFKDCTFYANVKSKQRLTLNLVAVNYNNLHFETKSVNTTTGSPVVTAIDSTENMHIGMHVVGTGIPTGTYILTIDSLTQVTLTKNATADGTGVSLEFQDVFEVADLLFYAGSAENVSTNTFKVFSAGGPAVNIDSTALSLMAVVNESATNDKVYCYYLSGYDDLPGKMLFEEQTIGGDVFTVISTAGDSFNPIITEEYESDNDERPNRIYFSKPQQPEAVPLLNYLDIGSEDKPIKRIIALRDSNMFVFKDDGIYRVSGADSSSFQKSSFDTATIIKGIDTLVSFNNQIFAYSNQGVISVSDSGVAVQSRPIENELQRISSDLFTNFDTTAFAISYESDRKYILFVPSYEGDVYPTQAYVYNSFTNSWTRWNLKRKYGIVNKSDNKLYLSDPISSYIYKERKTYTFEDYADDSYPVTIVSSNGTTVELADTSLLSKKWTLKQGYKESTIVSIDDATHITVTNSIIWNTGLADVYVPIFSELQWQPYDIKNPGVLKQFKEATFLFRDAAFNSITVGFANNFSSDFSYSEISPVSIGAFGEFSFGEVIFGGGLGGQQVIRTFVPLEKQRGSWLNINLRNEQAFTSFSLMGVSLQFNAMSERMR